MSSFSNVPQNMQYWNSTVDEIVTARLQMAHNLVDIYDVRCVAISTIVPRDNPRWLTASQYRSKADAVNHYTSREIIPNSSIYFHRHKGFWRDDTNQVADTSRWSTDGVHPNTQEGMKKYMKSITRCLHHTIKSISTLND